MLRSIVSNSAFSFVSDVASRLSSALLLILIARQLGEAEAGMFTLGNNYALILSAIALWGLDQLLIQNVAHDRRLSGQYFTHFLMIRMVLAPVLWALLAAFILGLQPYQPLTNRVIAVMGGTLIGLSVSNLVQSLLISQERMWLSALVSTVVSGLLLVTSFAAFSSGLGMEALALLIVVASWIQAAVLVWVSRKDLYPAGFRLDLSFSWRELGAGFPFVPIGLFIALEAQLGAVLLSFFHSEAAVGTYGMANTIVAALALLSQALRLGIFPAMARLYPTDHDRFVRLYERAWRYLAIIGFPVVILLVLFSEWIIYFVYRRPAPDAVLTLQWLAPTLLFYFLNIPNARLMILAGRQRMLARLFAISAFVNVLVGLLLIPHYGAPAVAMARVTSMAVLFTLGNVYVHRRILAARPWQLIWKPTVAAAIMALVVFVALPEWPLLVSGLIGVAVFGVLLILLRAIPTDDWLRLRDRLAVWARLGPFKRWYKKDSFVSGSKKRVE